MKMLEQHKIRDAGPLDVWLVYRDQYQETLVSFHFNKNM